MKQGRKGHSAGEAKPETLQKVFKRGFVQRKGLIFVCTSLHGGSPCKRHRHQADHAWAGFILHRLAYLVPVWRYLDSKVIALECD